MVSLCKKVYKNAITGIQFVHRVASGVDHKVLNSYLLKISQMRDIDSIIYQASRYLYHILEYEFFAFAVYDREHNGGLDIWVDPRMKIMTAVNYIRNDFLPYTSHYTIHYCDRGENGPASDLTDMCVTNLQTYKVMDEHTRAVLYILPNTMMLNYHRELLDMVMKSITASLSNFMNLKKLENAALVDPLTNCYNRRALNDYLERDLSNAQRYGADLAVIMFDIDHFKKVNDTLGHKAGDAVLRAVSRSVQSVIRRGDYLARYGGEEFLIVLPETKFSKAIELAERLRQAVADLKINLGDRPVSVTASFGIAAYKKGLATEQLLQRVDQMLYKAKQQGRNRITPDLRVCQSGELPGEESLLP